MSEQDKDNLKKLRGDAKRSNTLALRKFKGMLHLGLDEPDLKKQKEIVEESYDNLVLANLEFIEASEDNDDGDLYIKSNTDEYYELITKYRNLLKAEETIKQKKRSSILLQNVDRAFIKLNSVIDRLTSEDNLSKNVNELEEDKSLMDGNMNDLVELLSDLSTTDDVTVQNKDLNSLILKCQNIKRDINVSIRNKSSQINIKSDEGKELEIDTQFKMPDTSFSNTNMPVNSSIGSSIFMPSQIGSHMSNGNSLQTLSSHLPTSFESTSIDTSQVKDQFPMSNYTDYCTSSSLHNSFSETFVKQSYPNVSMSQIPIATSFASLNNQPVISTSLIQPSQYQRPDFSPMRQNPSQVYTKKSSLPLFSGNRADWPEFKVVWKSLAEAQFVNKMQLAMELKRCCQKGRAGESLRSIYITSDAAYDEMWSRLSEEYDDPGLSVQSALGQLMSVKNVNEGDYNCLVKFIDTVECVYNQLRELNQLDAVHMVDIDRISARLPRELNMQWQRRYRDLTEQCRQKPFPEFLSFLKKERSVVIRLTENSVKGERKIKTHLAEGYTASKHEKLDLTKGAVFCIIHGKGHSTFECKVFNNMSIKERFDKVREKHLCFNCLGKHSRKDCTKPLCKCGKGHHKLLCSGNKDTKLNKEHGDTNNSSSSHEDCEVKENESTLVKTSALGAATGDVALYPVHTVYLKGCKHPVTVFMDGGSNSSYITKSCAEKLKLKKVKTVSLDISTVGGGKKVQNSSVYEVPIITKDKKIITVIAYSLPIITNPTFPIDKEMLESLFPDFQVSELARPSKEIDILIGTDYFGLHPKTEIARSGKNLSIMSGELGGCLVGSHPQLKNFENSVLYTEGLETIQKNTYLSQSHPGFSDPQSFILGEELGMESSPKCGRCKCGKCPLPGHNLSFQEEQELKMIKQGLVYDADNQQWTASYPWLINPNSLPDNYYATKAALVRLEKSLFQNPVSASAYEKQMQDMIQRNVARKLSQKELNDWIGPSFYISHLAVKSPKSASTPVRIVFNSSQLFKGISLNNCLAKGPDCYSNGILGLLLRWRENKIAVVADIRKMYHSVRLAEDDMHCHRFLWRSFDSKREPDVYVIQRVNMGDRPAAAIATEALKQTAENCRSSYPKAAEFVISSSYMDDLIDSVHSKSEAEELARQTNEVLKTGGFFIKCWQFSTLKFALDANAETSTTSLLKGAVAEETSVLGIDWNPMEDNIHFHVCLNFSHKVRGINSEPNLKENDVPTSLPSSLTRRLVLRQVMSIYDPLGLLSPFTLKAKLLLRKTWELRLGWDEPMPENLQSEWRKFFVNMFQIESIKFERVLRPVEACHSPWLILFSDGSELAYGFVAYVRWQLKSGGYWCRMIMSKNRIAPLHKATIPRMELNGAVLSKRGRQVIEKEMRIKFERVLHLIDSQTVLNMIHKTSTRFKLYEGSRIGEIQNATNGDLSEWAWLPGESNIADCVTRGLDPDKINEKSEWWHGPPMLYTDFEEWNVKFAAQEDVKVPGEKTTCLSNQTEVKKEFIIDYDRFRDILKLRMVLARVLAIAKFKSFTGGKSEFLSPELLRLANSLLIKEAQGDMSKTLSCQYKCLNPKTSQEGLIVIGSRMSKFNPMTLDGKEQILLPTKHPLTKLLMIEAHQKGHLGRDSTVAKFRQNYWTPHADKLARTVKNACLECKRRDPKLNHQCMGNIPETRLKTAPPFSFTMIDLLGPFITRGEVQKRISGKCYFVLFTDLASRAIHLECVFGYSTDHFLMGLSRFVHMRGWPSVIYSDPGTQLVGAEREIKEAWQQIEKGELIKKGAESGTKWIFGPADSPWHQGAAESLVKTVKRCMQFAVHSQRLTPAEYLSIAYEIANLINERPIGYRPAPDSQINIFTPNMLLLGRSSAKNPSIYLPEHSNISARFELVRSVATDFWKRWIELYVPSLVKQNKWLKPGRDLVSGDIVLIAERGFKGEYKLAQVTETFPGVDGRVRKVNLRYKNLKTNEPSKIYKGASDIVVSRAVQKLALVVPVCEE